MVARIVIPHVSTAIVSEHNHVIDYSAAVYDLTFVWSTELEKRRHLSILLQRGLDLARIGRVYRLESTFSAQASTQRDVSRLQMLAYHLERLQVFGVHLRLMQL